MLRSHGERASDFLQRQGLENFAGKWVAVVDETIVHVSDDQGEVLRAVKERYPDRVPFVTYIPRPGVYIL